MSDNLSNDGERALAALAPQLAELDDADVIRPSADPHAAAVTALLVADYLGQPELRGKLDSVGITGDAVTELRHLARAIIKVVGDLGGDYLPDAKGIPGDLVSRGESVRATITTALEALLGEDRDAQQWLEAIRLGDGVVDLVYDLRTLGDLSAKHDTDKATKNPTTNAVQSARSAADAIEFALRTADSPELASSRKTLARLWTRFLPAYDRAAAAGRELTRGAGREREFPPLALVASHRRARRRPLSLVPPGGHPSQRRSLSPRTGARPPSNAPSAAPASRTMPNIPSSPALPALDDIELIEAEDVAEAASEDAPAAAPPRKTPSVPPTAAERESWSDTRIKKRHSVEIEVGIASQSNFYLGFTENLSAAGVFVATYASKPIGAEIEVALAFPNGDELKVHGVVRWLRDATTDGWPGMGVQFDSLTPDDEAKIRKFLSLRDPLFYDD